MNEPLAAKAKKEDKRPWLEGEPLEGMYFVQRISKDPNGRDRKAIAAAWVKKMTEAVRKHDEDSLITVGVIPLAQIFKGVKPVFYSPEAARYLDFVSIHFYPGSGKLEANVKALEMYDIGKPLVVEEIFPLVCNLDELADFMNRTDKNVDGWISHYFGKTIEEHRAGAEPFGPKSADFLTFWANYRQDKHQDGDTSGKK